MAKFKIVSYMYNDGLIFDEDEFIKINPDHRTAIIQNGKLKVKNNYVSDQAEITVNVVEVKMGRPIVGNKPKNIRVSIRMDEDEKKRLDTLAEKSGLSKSQYANSLIKEAWANENKH